MGEYTKLKIDGEKLKLRTDSLIECRYYTDNIYKVLQRYIYEENYWCSGIGIAKKEPLKETLKESVMEFLDILGFTALLSIPAVIATIFGLYKVLPGAYTLLCLIGLAPIKEGISEAIEKRSRKKAKIERKKLFEENKEKIEKVLEKHRQKLQEQEKIISKEKEEESNTETDTKVTTEVEHNEELVDAYIESMENTSTLDDISHQYIK